MNKKWYKHYLLNLVYTLAITLNTTYTGAKEIVAEEEISAKFITNYIIYTKWPEDVKAKSDPVTICTLPGDVTSTYLKKIQEGSNKIPSFKIKEKSVNSDFTDCHILYISNIYSIDQEYLIKITKGKPILTISNIQGFSEKGGVTGFTINPGSPVKLEINMKSATAAKITIDPDLLNIMKIYK